MGVKQESLFYWCERTVTGSKTYKEFFLQEKIYVEPYPNIISAFTVAELGEMLPSFIGIPTVSGGLPDTTNIDLKIRKTTYTKSSKLKPTWTLGYGKHDKGITDVSEANARARTLISLLENKLL